MKLCWWCKHFYYYNAQPGYSELTPGSDAEIRCSKNYWRWDQFDDSKDKFRESFEKARDCKDWTPIDQWKRDYLQNLIKDKT